MMGAEHARKFPCNIRKQKSYRVNRHYSDQLVLIVRNLWDHTSFHGRTNNKIIEGVCGKKPEVTYDYM